VSGLFSLPSLLDGFLLFAEILVVFQLLKFLLGLFLGRKKQSLPLAILAVSFYTKP
jgi:hypothetical protein